MADKVPLLCWSGGYDSTALLLKYLSDGIVPDTFYVATSLIGDLKSDIEIKRRNLILKKITAYFNVNIKDTIVTTTRNTETHNHYNGSD